MGKMASGNSLPVPFLYTLWSNPNFHTGGLTDFEASLRISAVPL